MQQLKNPWIIIGALTVAVFGGAIWYSGQAAERNNEGVEIIEAHVKGNPEAEVVLQEYSDFECPACRSFQPAISEVLELYGDRLRLEFHHFPLPSHRHAQLAARAAEAAGQQGAFFAYHDLLFANQQAWSNSGAPTSFFIQYAEELDLDVPTFRRHMNAPLILDKVREDFNEAQELGLTGTPSFILNGEQMQFQTYDAFLDQIATAVGATTSPNGASDASATSSTGAGRANAEADVRFGI